MIEPAVLMAAARIVNHLDSIRISNASILQRTKKMINLFPLYSRSVFITPKYWTARFLNEVKPSSRRLVWDGKRVIHSVVREAAILIRA